MILSSLWCKINILNKLVIIFLVVAVRKKKKLKTTENYSYYYNIIVQFTALGPAGIPNNNNV